MEILGAIVKYKKIAVASGNSLGKDYIAGGLPLWWLSAYYPAKVVITAPTDRQVRNILWTELERHFQKAGGEKVLGGRLKTQEWFIEEDRFCVAFTTKEVKGQTGKFQGYHCLSEDTEILTQRGFKTIDEIDLNDYVLSVKVGERKAEWKPIRGIYKYFLKGKINEITNRVVSLAVTDEHRFPTRSSTLSNKWSLKRLSEIPWKKFVIQRKISWEGKNFEVPAPFSVLTKEEFAEFIGFWTGDGGVRQHFSTKRFYEVLFYQKKDRNNKYIEKLLSKFRWTKARDYWCISNRKMAEWLIENIGRYSKDRKVPRFILDAPPEVIESYLEGFWQAEGSWENGEKRQAYSTSKELIDGIQEMLLKLGRPTVVSINKVAKLPCYRLSYTKTKDDTVIFKKHIRKVNYEGHVWCISTENNTFVARRHGKCFVSGNSPSLLIIVSEAQAVDDNIFEQIEGVATSENSRILLLGNPLHSTGYFARALQGSEYHSIHLSCLDTPNYIEKKEVIPGLASYEWVESMRKKYGEDSPIWQARVLGQLPKGQTIDAILDYYTARLAVNRSIYTPAGARRGISIDPAAFGDDEALIQIWEEKKLIHQESYPKTRTTQLSSRAIILAEKFDIDAFVIDTVAERGVFDEIYQAVGRKYQMFEFKGSFGAKDAEQYKNARAESYFIAQKEFESNAVSIPDDETLIEELCETKYFFTRDGKKQIEAKEEIKSRIGRSPNRADALTMWLWVLPEVKKKKKATRNAYQETEVITSINPWVV